MNELEQWVLLYGRMLATLGVPVDLALPLGMFLGFWPAIVVVILFTDRLCGKLSAQAWIDEHCAWLDKLVVGGVWLSWVGLTILVLGAL